MYLIERMSKCIARKTAESLKLDQEREEVIAYGALNFMHTMLTTVLLIVFGLVFRSLAEVMLVAVTSAVIRKYSGGIHASSPNHCAIISMILFGGLGLLVKYLPVFEIPLFTAVFQAVVAIVGLILFIRLCPVDSPNKRIRDPIKRKKLRNASVFMLLVFQVLTAVFWIWYAQTNSVFPLRLSACVSAGLAWQIISITSAGRFIIGKLVFLLDRIGL